FGLRWIAREKLSPQPRPVVPPAYRVVTDKIRHIRAYICGVPSIQGQNGDKACFTVACYLAENGLSFDEALAEFCEWNQVAAAPPWNVKELERKLRYAF